MKKYLLLSLLISIEPLFSQTLSTEAPSEKETYPICTLSDYGHRNTVINKTEGQEGDSNVNTDISSLESDQESSIAALDDSPTYSSPYSIGTDEIRRDQSSLIKNNSQSVDSNFRNDKNNNIRPTPGSLFKNPSSWWQSKRPQEKEALIKTGVFIAGCGVATFFPEYSIGEKLLILVCLPCFIELGESVTTAINTFS